MGDKLSKRWNVPWVFEAVDVWPDVPIGMGVVKNPLLKANLHRNTNKLYASAAKVVALSPGMRQQILAHQVDPEKVVVSYNGTDPQLFRPIPHTNDKVQFVYAGALGKANDVQRLVKNWRLMHDKDSAFKNAQLTIYGFGAFEDNIREQIDRYNGLGVNVEFAGTLPKHELAQVLGQFDVGVCWFAPYNVLEANSANKFYDYLAAGLPVVANYAGWQGDILHERNCGLAGLQGDNSTFQDNVRRLISEPRTRKTMSFNARQTAVELFDREQIAADLLLMIQQVIRQTTD